MATHSQNLIREKSPKIGLVSENRTVASDESLNWDNSLLFAKRLLSELPISSKLWAYEMRIDESYIRKMRKGERPILEKTAEEIIAIADAHTTTFLRWKLEVDVYRQIKSGRILK